MDTNSRLQRFIFQSNRWYNDGLAKAKVHDFSGAIASLSRSLQYNKANKDARNLLGLIYYGEGEVAKALVQWIISRNLNPEDNLADRFIKKIQSSNSRMESLYSAIKKYNQCLEYCRKDGEDLAIIQLKKIVALHPYYLNAQQLLALLYLKSEQYSKARKCLRRALKIDTTNMRTLRYIQELNELVKKSGRKEKEEEGGVTYQVGNETIIQPLAEGFRENARHTAVLNILLGVAIGIAVLGFVVVPAVRSSDARHKSEEMVAYSEQIANRESEIEELNQKLAKADATVKDNKKSEKENKSVLDSYESLIKVSNMKASSADSEAIADELMNISEDKLSANGKELYQSLSKKYMTKASASLFKTGKYYYNSGNYKNAKTNLTKLISMDEQYNNGEALMLLAKVYEKTNEKDKASSTYNRVIELYKGKKVADEAKKAVASLHSTGSTKAATNQ